MRLQVDLIDKQDDPSGGNRWILTVKCHATKWVKTTALPNKQGKAICCLHLIQTCSGHGRSGYRGGAW